MRFKSICKAFVLLSLAIWIQGCESPAAPAGTAAESKAVTQPAKAMPEPTAAKTPAERTLATAPLSDTQSPVPCPSVTGPLHVEGAKLWGSDGSPVQLKGISTHGLAWFPDYVNEECFSQLKTQWNVNVIRLAL